MFRVGFVAFEVENVMPLFKLGDTTRCESGGIVRCDLGGSRLGIGRSVEIVDLTPPSHVEYPSVLDAKSKWSQSSYPSRLVGSTSEPSHPNSLKLLMSADTVELSILPFPLASMKLCCPPSSEF